MGCLIAKSDTQNGSNFLNMLKFYFLQNQNKLRIFGFLCKILCQTGNICQFFFSGYFVESLAEGVAMSLRALLGEPCLSLDALPCPDDSTG